MVKRSITALTAICMLLCGYSFIANPNSTLLKAGQPVVCAAEQQSVSDDYNKYVFDESFFLYAPSEEASLICIPACSGVYDLTAFARTYGPVTIYVYNVFSSVTYPILIAQSEDVINAQIEMIANTHYLFVLDIGSRGAFALEINLIQRLDLNYDEYTFDDSFFIYAPSEDFPLICIPQDSGLYNLDAYVRGAGYNHIRIYDLSFSVYDPIFSVESDDWINSEIALEAGNPYLVTFVDVLGAALVFGLDLIY